MTDRSASATRTSRKRDTAAGRTGSTEPAGSSDPAASDPPGRTLAQLADIPVDRVNRIGARRSESLLSLGIESVVDLVMHYPRRYIDRTRQSEVAGMQVGEESVVVAEVMSAKVRRIRGGRVLVELEVKDDTGLLRVVFFNQGWRAKQLPVGTNALFFGKLDTYRGRRQFTNPVVDLVGNRTGRIVPIYPTSEASGIAGWEFGEWVGEALWRARPLHDPLPTRFLEDLGLVGRAEAFSGIHHPSTFAEQAAARRRLAFDELLRLQLEVVMRRHEAERDARGIKHVTEPTGDNPDLVGQFVDGLDFTLTAAQSRAATELERDLSGPLPMNRLLQGDVGSGKTVVALCALLTGIQGGYQGAFMAPTEVLAEQHFLSVQSMLDHLVKPDEGRLGGTRPVAVALLTSRTPAAERSRVRAGLADGSVDLVVGTHALLTEDVRFASLGVAVVDEQHRFGVEQRAALKAKGRDAASGVGADPDVLVMTATPIPRTAAMVVFGDLDMTVLDELPAGRTPVVTSWARTDADDDEVWERIRSEVAAGHRAFVVCPLVDGSERVQARSATDELDRLGETVLAGLRVGLLHGQLKASEKEPVMAAFRRGEIEVLVSTTVIEVGVDVPEATVMVIEDADRFGIAQLHQLRGRVGRSDLQSWCYLLSRNTSPEATTRLEALESSSDGFELAEVDLDLRGEGTILGARQKGRSDLKLATLRPADRRLVQEARQVAEEILAEDPALERHTELAEELRLFLGEDAAFLQKS
jgi:ATP-dependent DNA helicase RecG